MTKVKIQSAADQLQFDAVKACGRDAVMRFVEMVQKGESVRMAAMLATHKPPGKGFDDQVYQKNRKSLLEQFDNSPEVLRAWNAQYRKETGEDIPPDAVVFREFAQRIGDSRCVLTHKNSMDDIKKYLRERNVQVEGSFDMESQPEAPVVQEVRLADDLVEQCVDEYIAEDPELAHEDRNELREMVIDKHSHPMATTSDLNPLGTENFKQLSTALFV